MRVTLEVRDRALGFAAPLRRGTLGKAAWWATAMATAVLAVVVLMHLGGGTKRVPPGRPSALPKSAGTIQTLDMVGERSGWALTTTDKVLRTSDEGTSWDNVTPDGFPQGVNPFYVSGAFADSSHAWVAVSLDSGNGQTVIFRTADGGQTWASTRVAPGRAQMDFVSDSVGFSLLHEGSAAGNENVEVLRTTDGGASWQLVADDNPVSGHTPPLIFGGDKTGITFISPQRGWLTGTWPANTLLLFGTENGGRAWQVQTLTVPAGLSAEAGAGATWPPVFFGSSNGVMPVTLINQAGRQVTVFYSTLDGGTTWTPTSPVVWAHFTQPLVYSIVSVDHIVGIEGSHVYRTTNGGTTWNETTSEQNVLGMSLIDFTSLYAGWGVLNGNLLQTQNGGRSWTAVTVSPAKTSRVP